MENTKKPIINCHMHVFCAEHVPPFLARSYVLWPIYYLIHLGFIVSLFRLWYNRIYPFCQKPLYKTWQIFKTRVTWCLNAVAPVKIIISYYLTIQVFYIIYQFIGGIVTIKPGDTVTKVEQARVWLAGHYLLLTVDSIGWRIVLVLVVLLLIPSGRNLIFFIFKSIWKFLALLPGPKAREMFKRYLNLGRYAFHRKQVTILDKVCDQYPPGTGFVILPMDMEFMGAGRVRTPYRDQMEDLAAMKKNPRLADKIFPFVFADPRRMTKEPDYFRYTIVGDKVILENCFIKRFLEVEQFSGIKIYPALGYYPFDERLLPLWKYTADNEIPITTHCIRGTIFYRGSKEWDWNRHPIFGQAMGGGEYPPLLLPETKNVDFTPNFTHPLNYLCLLDESKLRLVVGNAKDKELHKLFGYTDADTPLASDLRHLKLCFGHFGGDDEWKNFFEKDRYGFSAQIIKHPDTGIDFDRTTTGDPSPGKPEQLWKYTDWYSIIYSMILQYDHVYADISYILHDNAAILPLLKQTLQNSVVRTKVLYGTDFYVVRNHKSDKNMVADMEGGLSMADFDQIARDNPREFLFNKLNGKIPI